MSVFLATQRSKIIARYDYKCKVCSYTEEWEHSIFEDKNGTECVNPYDHCVGQMHRTFNTPTPAVFKGDGWAKLPEYKTPKGQFE